MIRTREEIQEKIDQLNGKIEAIKALDPEEVTNEDKVVLAGSELEAILLTSVLDSDEETVKGLLERYEHRGEILDRDYQKAHKYDQKQKKNELHAMIWTNDIRVDTYRWVLDEEETDI